MIVRGLTILSIIIVIPLGFLCKLYKGSADWLFNYYGGSILYEIFWCLFFFLFIPRRNAVTQIPIWVFIVTCILEFLQLWHPPFLEQIRANLWGRLLLGTKFDWWDFIPYIIGSFLGYLWLRQIWHYEKTSQG
jgi:Protein of unknown function (DUF2809)